MKQLIVATGNAHKADEFDKLLKGCGLKVASAKICGGMPNVVEDGANFGANARLKALALRKIAPSDAWVVSDDSGLEVDALGGEPGIYSARYAGEGASDLDNLNKLLRALMKETKTDRRARFKCALCLISPTGDEHFFEGACEGSIAKVPSGSEGFGYDPVFVPEGYKQSFAELGEGTKSRLSHRAFAVAAMRAYLTS